MSFARKALLLKGTSLMEVLLAVAILAILLLGGLTGWRVQLAKARDAERKNELAAIRLAMMSYYEDRGCFPEPEGFACNSGFLAPYIPFIPCDPVNSGSYQYVYVKEACDKFSVFTRLENESDEAIDSLGCSSGCGPGGGYSYYVTAGNEVVESGGGEGVDPTCGTLNKYCFANTCSSCCPGDNYRCNGAGNKCLYDATCGNGQ